MANIIDYTLYIHGPKALVDTITQGPFPRCYSEQTLTVSELASDVSGTKVSKVSNDCANDPPVQWLLSLVETYHDQGVRFFMRWFDACNWDFEEPVANYRFGEMYTAPITSFTANVQSAFTPETGEWYFEGPITIISNRFDPKGVTEVWHDGKCVNLGEIVRYELNTADCSVAEIECEDDAVTPEYEPSRCL